MDGLAIDLEALRKVLFCGTHKFASCGEKGLLFLDLLINGLLELVLLILWQILEMR